MAKNSNGQNKFGQKKPLDWKKNHGNQEVEKSEIELVAKKRFGQNFLINNGIKSKVLENFKKLKTEFPEIGNILEIGPGKGDITELLLAECILSKHNFTALEIDPEAIEFLQNKFNTVFDPEFWQNKNDLENLENTKIRKAENWLQFGDALELTTNKKLPFENFILFSSLPYNVGSRIIVELVINYPQCPFCVIVQKEVATKTSIKSNLTFFGAFLGLFYDFDKVFDIVGGNFQPAPKVTSSLLIARPKQLLKTRQNLKNNYPNSHELGYKLSECQLEKILKTVENRQKICQTLKTLFGMPSKTLGNNLKPLGWGKDKINLFLDENNWQKTRLSWDNYKEILMKIWTNMEGNLDE